MRPAEALRDAAVDRGVMTLGRWVVGLPAHRRSGRRWPCSMVEADPKAQLPLTFAAATLADPRPGDARAAAAPRLVALLVLPARGAGGMLMRQHARAGVRRTAAIAAPVLVGGRARRGAGDDGRTRSTPPTAASAQARVAPDAVVVTADGDLSESDVAALRAVPGTVVGATLEADLRTGGITYRAIGADPAALR